MKPIEIMATTDKLIISPVLHSDLKKVSYWRIGKDRPTAPQNIPT